MTLCWRNHFASTSYLAYLDDRYRGSNVPQPDLLVEAT